MSFIVDLMVGGASPPAPLQRHDDCRDRAAKGDPEAAALWQQWIVRRATLRLLGKLP